MTTVTPANPQVALAEAEAHAKLAADQAAQGSRKYHNSRPACGDPSHQGGCNFDR